MVQDYSPQVSHSSGLEMLSRSTLFLYSQRGLSLCLSPHNSAPLLCHMSFYGYPISRRLVNSEAVFAVVTLNLGQRENSYMESPGMPLQNNTTFL